MRKLICFALAAGLAAAASPALADDVTIKIDLGSLEIADPADDAAIRERIVAEVGKACRRHGTLSLTLREIKECKSDGVDKALDELEARRALIAAN